MTHIKLIIYISIVIYVLFHNLQSVPLLVSTKFRTARQFLFWKH